MHDFNGRTAIVTGAGTGIGRALALALAAEGASLLLVGRRAARLHAVAGEIDPLPGRAEILACDVAEPDSFERMRDQALAQFGRIDIVVNNAGAIAIGFPEQIPLEQWRRVFEINLMALVRSNAVMLPILLAQGHGHIVNVASVDGLYGFGYDRLPYASSKAAAISLSEGLALYLKPKGIGVTCLCPGPVATNVADSMQLFGPSIPVHGPGADLAMLPADAAAATLLDAIRANRLLALTHPPVHPRLQARAADLDAFVDHQIANPQILFTTP